MATTLRQGAPPSAAGQEFLDTTRRVLRRGRPMLAMVVHFGALEPPAPRPHHRRIARALLQEAALRHGGQAFALPCGDLALICEHGDGLSSGDMTAGLGSTNPGDLPAVFARVLRQDAPDPSRLISMWRLPEQGELLLAFAEQHASDPVAVTIQPVVSPAQPARALRMIDEVIEGAQFAGLVHREVAVLLSGAGNGAARLRPLFRKVSFSVAALEAQVAEARAAWDDTFLFRHFSTRLDRRLVALLDASCGSGSPLDPCRSGVPATHVNLAVSDVGSALFNRIAAKCRQAPRADGQPALGIGISLLDACADHKAFLAAAKHVQEAGCALALDGISYLTLLMTEIAVISADLVKLDWSLRLAKLSPNEAGRLERALDLIGRNRMVLQGADSEAAIRWGMANGIRRFQGRHVDIMTAAARIERCAQSAACTLRQCTERATAAIEPGRRLCRNTALLDAAIPEISPELAVAA